MRRVAQVDETTPRGLERIFGGAGFDLVTLPLDVWGGQELINEPLYDANGAFGGSSDNWVSLRTGTGHASRIP